MPVSHLVQWEVSCVHVLYIATVGYIHTSLFHSFIHSFIHSFNQSSFYAMG